MISPVLFLFFFLSTTKLKAENVLIDEHRPSAPVYVLCDFGSATTKVPILYRLPFVHPFLVF